MTNPVKLKQSVFNQQHRITFWEKVTSTMYSYTPDEKKNTLNWKELVSSVPTCLKKIISIGLGIAKRTKKNCLNFDLLEHTTSSSHISNL